MNPPKTKGIVTFYSQDNICLLSIGLFPPCNLFVQQSAFAFESIISRYIVKFLYIFALYWRFSRLFTLKSIKKALSAFYSQKCNLYTCKLSIQVTIPSFLLLQKVIHTIHYEVVLPLKFSRIPYAPNHHIL